VESTILWHAGCARGLRAEGCDHLLYTTLLSREEAGATFLRQVEFQWFLTLLSVRPGSSFAISAQRFPSLLWASTRRSSSSSVHASCAPQNKGTDQRGKNTQD